MKRKADVYNSEYEQKLQRIEQFYQQVQNVLPMSDASRDALNRIDKMMLAELKAYKYLPSALRIVMDLVVIALGGKQ